MTSLASSEPLAMRRGPARFPPRNELPPGVTIAKVPFLGRAWYERGFLYWCRRVAGVIVCVMLVTVYLGIIAGVVSAAGPAGSPGFLAVVIGESVFTLVTAVFTFRYLRRQASTAAAPAGRQPSVSAGWSAFFVFKWGVVGGALLAIAALLTAGFAVALLAIWLPPELPAEQVARRTLDQRLNLARLRASNTHHPARRRRRR